MKIMGTNKQKGQSLVESALIIPLVFLLIFTFLDLGRAIYYYSALGNAVREGARFASVTKVEDQADKDTVIARVDNYSVAVKPNSVDVCWPNPNDSSSCVLLPSDLPENVTPVSVTISASFAFKPITPFLTQMLGLGQEIPLNAETTMRLAPFAKN